MPSDAALAGVPGGTRQRTVRISLPWAILDYANPSMRTTAPPLSVNFFA